MGEGMVALAKSGLPDSARLSDKGGMESVVLAKDR